MPGSHQRMAMRRLASGASALQAVSDSSYSLLVSGRDVFDHLQASRGRAPTADREAGHDIPWLRQQNQRGSLGDLLTHRILGDG